MTALDALPQQPSFERPRTQPLLPGQGLSTTLTMPSCFFWNVA
jgi:hypothetical protein